MITKTLWKDMIRAIKKSKGRFFSLMCLMALGSFALVGLKVTGPDMERTASHYLEKQQVMDMAVLASHQFSQEDRKELNTLKDVVLEYGHLIDLNITKDQQALRLYSLPNKLSKPLLVEGHWPKQDTEIVLSTALEKSYQLGDTIRVTPPSKGLLTSERFRVVGFAHSSELWSKSNLGGASAGDGSLYAYAFSRPNVFKGDANILRLRFNNLRFANAFSKQYRQTVTQNQTTLDQLLQDNSQRRYEELKGQYKLALTNGKAKLQSEQTTLAAREQELGFLKGSALQEAKDQLEQAHKAMEQEKSRLRQVELAQSKLERPHYTTYNRSTLPGAEGYRTYATSISSISNVGNIFPLVLYLVAALVAFTTMTRYVDEERTTSGLLKALGYSNREISLKFLGYGLIASFLGTSLGILGGTYVLPALISDILTAPLTIGKTHLYFYDAYSALAYLLALLSTVLPAYLVVKKELFLNAAQLLLPKPPSKGANIWLEHITIIWKRLSFSHKVTIRNIFRYKQRMRMTIIGVAGSVALLFAGLGIQSSLAKVIDHQFGELMTYDILAVGASKSTLAEETSLQKVLSGKEIARQKKISYAQLTLPIKGITDKQTISILSTPAKTLSPYVNLLDSQKQKAVAIPKSGVLISEKLASYYHVKAGDELWLQDNGLENDKINLKVKQVIDMTVGHYLIMSDTYYAKQFNNLETSPAYFINLKHSSHKKVKQLASKMLSLKAITVVSQNANQIQAVQLMVASLDQVMSLLVIVSVLLAIVILYNLTSINIAERIRELSTVKVLGFYDKEVTFYIYRETISLSLIGILIGILLGKALHAYIMRMISTGDIQFGNKVDSYVYLVPIVIILSLLLVLGIWVHQHLKKVDMLEALKSID
ncbi:FtsX-like permease family protein [Streptococcus dysgalactiae]|uniref:FtsX-like permease family protein n=1 Tax=Streptococcus dysgalactiae TaxID=1334 RepID=UPI001C4C4B4D|nr:FtsX-like permease family protein [Streptococcus dysgalactiae]